MRLSPDLSFGFQPVAQVVPLVAAISQPDLVGLSLNLFVQSGILRSSWVVV